MERVDTIVIGAGVVGLACARALALAGREVIVLESESTIGTGRAGSFYGAIRRYWPGLKDGAVQPAYSGIRPKIQARGEPARDFLIQGPKDHGVAGWVNLFGIESPGLTAAIGEHVRELLRD